MTAAKPMPRRQHLDQRCRCGHTRTQHWENFLPDSPEPCGECPCADFHRVPR